jgi:hypothetical protein
VRLAKGGIDYLNSGCSASWRVAELDARPADDTSSDGAATAVEAIDILQSAGTRIASSSVTLVCPVTDGIHLARWVNENRAGLPVVMTSGDAARSS